MTPDALAFVYNANVGLGWAIIDSLHKTLSPATYDCQLCAVTYDAVRMRPQWRDWLRAQPWAAEFYHRQDFFAAWPDACATPLPAIFRRDGTALTLLIDAAAVRGLGNVDALIGAIEGAL